MNGFVKMNFKILKKQIEDVIKTFLVLASLRVKKKNHL